MIIDQDWDVRNHKFTISYVNEKGTKSFYEFSLNRFKDYYDCPTGQFKNWDGRPCTLRYTDRPNKFSIKEFIEDLPQEVKDNLFNTKYIPKVYSWDIETFFDPNEKPDPQSAKFPITAISVVNPDMTVMVLGYKPLTNEEEDRIRVKVQKYCESIPFFRELKIDSNFMYKKFDCEHDMLQWFLKNIVSKVPLLIGWNSDGFDTQYVMNRVKNYYEDISLASSSCKYRMTTKKVVNIFHPTDFVRVPIPLHTHMADFMDVVRQHDFTVLPMKESMSLDWVSSQVLNAHKIEYDGNLNTLYDDDFEHFVFYNAIDSILVQLLHKRFKTYNIIFNYANITHLPIGDCYGKIAPAEALFFQNFHERGLKVVYYPDKHPERGHLIGAFVKEPIPGFYQNPCCFDFSGLYPTNILCYNLSVENFVGAFYDEEKLRPYRADTDKYVVVCGSVYTNKNAGKPNKKPDPDKFIAQFLDEKRLRPYREDPNYIVSINGHVYKNDQDYAFRQIQLKLKQNRNQTKYLAKELDAQVVSVIDRVMKKHSNSDWTPFSDDVKEWMSKNYGIVDKHGVAEYANLADLKHHVLEDIENFYSREQSFKLLGNSAYGGSSHPAFYWFNIEMANDITGEGRNLIHMMEKKTQEVFDTFNTMTDEHKKLGITIDQKLYEKNVTNCVSTIYQDTDSVASDTIINTNNGRKTIEQLYNENIDRPAGTTIVGHESVECKDLVANYKNNEIQYSNVKRVIRHKVSKKKWKLRSASGKEVICTNDHSLVVFRDGVQTVVKPYEIQKGDKVLTVIEKYMDCIFEEIEVCECIGEFEDEFVYDIEMDDDTHTFIANDILVHNSSYVNMGPIVNSIEELKGKSDKERCDFLIRFADEFWNGYFDKILTKYITSRHGKNFHVFELETIAKSGIWIGVKKRYAQAILCKDGRIYDEPKIKIKGLEIAKSSYPACARRTLSELVNMLLLENDGDKDFIHKVNMKMMECKNLFETAPVDDISMAIKVSDYWKNVENDNDPSGLKLKKGISYNARALALYNWLINTKRLPGDNIYGGKVKCYLIKKKTRKEEDSYFAYTAGSYPKWGPQYAPIDRDTMFQKTVLEPINRILTKIGFQELHLDGSIEFSLFDF